MYYLRACGVPAGRGSLSLVAAVAHGASSDRQRAAPEARARPPGYNPELSRAVTSLAESESRRESAGGTGRPGPPAGHGIIVSGTGWQPESSSFKFTVTGGHGDRRRPGRGGGRRRGGLGFGLVTRRDSEPGCRSSVPPPATQS